MAHIEYRGGNKYRISMCVNRIRASKIVEARNLKEAEKMAAVMENNLKENGDINRPTVAVLKKMTFNELWDSYLEWNTKEKYNPIRATTAKKYTNTMKYQLEPYFKGMRVVHINEDTVNNFLIWLESPEARIWGDSAEKFSNSTIAATFAQLSSMMKYAKDRLKIIDVNPCKYVGKPKSGSKGNVPFYEEKELKALLDAVDKETASTISNLEAHYIIGTWKPITLQKKKVQALFKKTCVYLCVYTACRRGEALGLHREDIDFEAGTITYHHELLYTTEAGIYLTDYLKGKKEENTVGIHPDLEAVLKELISEIDILFEHSGDSIPYTSRLFFALTNTKQHKVGGYVFPDRYSTWFGELLRDYKLPHINLHKLRHSSISYMLHMGVSREVVAGIAGHATVEQVEQTYGHIYNYDKREATKVFDSLRDSGSEVEDDRPENNNASEE